MSVSHRVLMSHTRLRTEHILTHFHDRTKNGYKIKKKGKWGQGMDGGDDECKEPLFELDID